MTNAATKQKELPTPPISPDKFKKPAVLPSLDVAMESLDLLDRTGPLTATSGSAFLVSPVIGATLLTSAAKLAKNAEPPLMSPSTPIVWHPISLNKAALMGATAATGIPPPSKNYDKVLFEGQIRPVAVAAFEDLLFLTRIAKWKVAYHEGRPFNRSEQLPYCEWGSLPDMPPHASPRTSPHTSPEPLCAHARPLFRTPADHAKSAASMRSSSATPSRGPSPRSGRTTTPAPPPRAPRPAPSPISSSPPRPLSARSSVRSRRVSSSAPRPSSGSAAPASPQSSPVARSSPSSSSRSSTVLTASSSSGPSAWASPTSSLP